MASKKLIRDNALFAELNAWQSYSIEVYIKTWLLKHWILTTLLHYDYHRWVLFYHVVIVDITVNFYYKPVVITSTSITGRSQYESNVDTFV